MTHTGSWRPSPVNALALALANPSGDCGAYASCPGFRNAEHAISKV